MANHLTPLLAGCLSQMCGRVITAFPHDQHHSWPWIMTPGGSPVWECSVVSRLGLAVANLCLA